MKFNNLLICFAFLSIFMMIMPMVSAEEIRNIKQGSSFNIPITGNNGTGPWPNCNISTVIDPDMQVALRDVAMTKNGISFNYSFSNTTKLGTYTVNSFCYDDSGPVTGTDTFIVTTTGDAGSSSYFMFIAILVVAILLTILAFVFDSTYFIWAAGILFILTAILVYFYGFGNISDVYTFGVAATLFIVGMSIFFASSFLSNGEGISQAFGIEKKERDEYDYFEGEE